ncbi:MAG: DUF11 domain-containing protein [Phycisphaerae bacterium]|nr:DUF11 domain-containing protein [Phycisphaerae bacterium]
MKVESHNTTGRWMRGALWFCRRPGCERGFSTRCMAIVLLFLAATAGVAAGKSMYVIAQIVNFLDGKLPIHVYDIGTDGKLTYQTEFLAPFLSAGMVGIAMDSDSGHLFCTYENSGRILVVDATTLEQEAILAVSNASNLAGVVYDHEKGLLYCTDCGGETLYAMRWDPDKCLLTPTLGSPFPLQGAQAFGIALDEYNDLLYVAGPTREILVYSTWDWSLVRSLPVNRIALSIAVDPARDCLYYGGGFLDSFYLTRHQLSGGETREVLVDPNAGVMGLGVDLETGLIYLTTGRDNREGGKDLMVFDADLRQLQVIEQIGRPTGLAIPFHNTQVNAEAEVTVAYEAIEVEKIVVSPIDELNERDRPCVGAGEQVTYAIQLRNPSRTAAVTQLTIVDELPPEMAFVWAQGDGKSGSYDAKAHTYTWVYPLLTAGGQLRLELVAQVDNSVETGTVVSNVVSITSRQAAVSRARADVAVTDGAVRAQMFLEPTYLWRNPSQATQSLRIVIHLPEGYGKERIVDAPLVLTPGNVQSSSMKIYGSSTQGKILCFFDTPGLLAATEGCGQFTIRVAGDLTGGAGFVCSGTLAILRFGGP